MIPYEKLFAQLQDVAAVRDLIGKTEDLHLDCKIWPKEEDGQRVLAKALCGFANAEGGVLLFGLQAKSGPSKDAPDLIEKEVPVSDAVAVKSRVENLVGQLVEPPIEGVRVVAVLEGRDSTAGFVVVSIPPTEGLPCRSRKDWKFYLRISAGTLPMEYFQIADMFGKRRRPVLKLYLDEGRVESRKGIPIRLITFGIENCGRAVARFPSIRFRLGSLQVDSFGIDGNHGFGLPQRPSDPDMIIFGGGSDHVIYPGTILKIAKLEQASKRSEWQPVDSRQEARYFPEVEFVAQLAADEFPNATESHTIKQRELFERS